MESSQLVSWQFENFSTAELSPPTSPVSPSSPLFYNDGSNSPSSPSGTFKGLNSGATMLSSNQSQKPALSSALSSRAQTACNILNELEQMHSFEEQNAFGMDMGEESVSLNMDLFEELADLEYTPPLSSSHETKSFEVPQASSAPIIQVVTPPPQQQEASNDNAKLSNEFKSIVESLTTSNRNVIPSVTTFNDLLQITGIPTTTVVGDECLVPVEFIGRPSTTTSGDFGAEEVESMDLDGIIISNDMALINENELFSLEELSAELTAEDCNIAESATLVNGVLPYWAKDMAIPLDELDTQMTKNDETLNALLKGDVSTAKTAISSDYLQQQAFSPVSNASEDPSVLEEAEIVEVIEPKPVVTATTSKKAERRGRKPTKKDSLNYVKDKALRKKEQNKTAATRYRQKKKEELSVTLAEEEELQTINDELQKEKDKVGAELRMIRSLMRDMLQARKKRTVPSSTVPASSRLTASSIVQAQRIANRRK